MYDVLFFFFFFALLARLWWLSRRLHWASTVSVKTASVCHRRDCTVACVHEMDICSGPQSTVPAMAHAHTQTQAAATTRSCSRYARDSRVCANGRALSEILYNHTQRHWLDTLAQFGDHGFRTVGESVLCYCIVVSFTVNLLTVIEFGLTALRSDCERFGGERFIVRLAYVIGGILREKENQSSLDHQQTLNK